MFRGSMVLIPRPPTACLLASSFNPFIQRMHLSYTVVARELLRKTQPSPERIAGSCLPSHDGRLREADPSLAANELPIFELVYNPSVLQTVHHSVFLLASQSLYPTHPTYSLISLTLPKKVTQITAGKCDDQQFCADRVRVDR